MLNFQINTDLDERGFESIMQGMAEKVNRLFNHRRFNLIAFFMIAILILIAYSNTFHASFHFDDNPSIVDNYTIKVVNADNIMTSAQHQPARGLPELDAQLQPGRHERRRAIIFSMSDVISQTAFLCISSDHLDAELPVLEKRYADKARRMALFAALLFAVHPVQTEAVTYIISRTELLATFFYLGAMLMFIQGVRKKKFAWFSALHVRHSSPWGPRNGR